MLRQRPLQQAVEAIPIEYFTMVFEKSGDGNTNLLMAWDEVLVRLPIKI